eukprot:symbB.v1.2.018663.t1/scaffold1499.1/size115214/5
MSKEDEADVAARVAQLRKETSRLKADLAEKEFESSQLEKQLRRLERKIAAFDTPETGLAKGFLKSASTQKQEATVPPVVPPVPKVTCQGYDRGIIIDGLTGKEVDLATWEDTNDSRQGHAAMQLFAAMQQPPELNAEFDANRYAKLLGEGRQAEAEALIRAEGGPTLEQMQQEPLEILRTSPDLDINWKNPQMHGCSLLQYACSMGYDEVTRELLTRRADVSHRGHGGVSCLATALAHSSCSCAALLLDAKAQADEVADPDGQQTLLMWASRIDYVNADGCEVPNPLVALLLTHGANVHRCDARGKTPLMHPLGHKQLPKMSRPAAIDKYGKLGDMAFNRMEKVNADLFVLTYGSLVTQLLRDIEDVDAVNAQLEKMGYNIGLRLIDEFLAKSGVNACQDFRDTCDVIAKVGLRMFLGVSGEVVMWNKEMTACSLVLPENPLAQYVELPANLTNRLWYSNLICGVIRGCLEQLQLRVECRFEKDALNGDEHTLIRLELMEVLHEDYDDD